MGTLIRIDLKMSDCIDCFIYITLLDTEMKNLVKVLE